MTGEYTSPIEMIRVRHYRYEGLTEWKVYELGCIPPLLLQLALILFFIGLSDFLRQLNPFVGWFITGLVIVWLVLFASSGLASILSHRCYSLSPSQP